MVKDSQILRGVIFAGSISVFTEGQVKNPVEAVFNVPVGANSGQELAGNGRQAAAVMLHLISGYLTLIFRQKNLTLILII